MNNRPNWAPQRPPYNTALNQCLSFLNVFFVRPYSWYGQLRYSG